MGRTYRQSNDFGQEKAQTVPILLQLEPAVRATLKKVARDQQMTYAELITDMLKRLYPEVLAKAHQVEEIGWEL